MDQTSDKVMKDIESTRREMGRTVEEMSRRINLPGRLKSASQRSKEVWFGRGEGAAAQGAARPQRSGMNPRVLAAIFFAGVFMGMLIVRRRNRKMRKKRES